ncbi:hypothetical protein KFK09_026491 [Dendrobium nobile]|uniref:NAD(P)-binding domain-containing protein n=1 Tax=Dendrobium nobile TaxID=94219 RepID=A0A8T3A8W2_DENNO|nr:hypothetical protein KFK09_026491 [Dendrobium nobile]
MQRDFLWFRNDIYKDRIGCYPPLEIRIMAIIFRAHYPPHSAFKSRKVSTRFPAANFFSTTIKMEGTSATAEETKEQKPNKIFVAGSTGKTGKRIVEQLLSKSYGVRAGARDVEKAKSSLPQHPNLQIVDNFGTVNLVEACRKIGVKRFVLVSSILVNGAAMGQLLNPAYIVLNLFGLTLIAKLQAEKYIKRSGINYTIIRPGGLRNDPPSGNIVMEPEDTLFEGSISRDQVAEVAVEALQCPESYFKVIEIVSRVEAPKRPLKDLFSGIKQK